MELELVWWFSALAALFVVLAIYFRNLPTAVVGATLLLLIGFGLVAEGVKLESGKTITANSTLANITSTTEVTSYATTKNDYTRGVGLISIVFSFYLLYAFLLPREEGEDEVSN